MTYWLASGAALVALGVLLWLAMYFADYLPHNDDDYGGER